MEEKKMRAVRVHRPGGPEVLTLEEVARPEAGPGQVLVRVRAAGVNPVDTYVRSGDYARVPPHPYTPGSDAAGLVESVGEGVSRVRRGDRVYTARTLSGAYAELALCEEAQVHPLPERVSFAQGAAVGVPYATAYRALFQRAGARAGETVLVHGATGGVGIAAVQLARAAGLVVVGTGGSAEGREEVLRQGARHVLDHRAPGYLDRVAELTGGRGADLVLEMLAHVNLGKVLAVLAPGGRVVVIGSRGTVEIDPRDTMSRDAAILGMSLFNASAADLASIHAGLAAGLENGTLEPLVGEEIPLAEAPRAHERVMAGGHRGKVVLIP
jgi:NADPH:quinone reductase